MYPTHNNESSPVEVTVVLDSNVRANLLISGSEVRTARLDSANDVSLPAGSPGVTPAKLL